MKIIRSCDRTFIAASHEDPKAPGVFKKVLALKDELFRGRVQMINWAKLPTNSSFRNHYHEDMEEVFVIISGRIEVICNDKKDILEGGDTIIISPTERHSMRNIGEIEAQYLVVGISGDKNGKTVVV